MWNTNQTERENLNPFNHFCLSVSFCYFVQVLSFFSSCIQKQKINKFNQSFFFFFGFLISSRFLYVRVRVLFYCITLYTYVISSLVHIFSFFHFINKIIERKRNEFEFYLITWSCRPTWAKASIHRSRSAFEWAAETCTRIRARPFGT